MWPAAFWEKLYEPIIRKAAGLGRATYEADPDTYEKCWAHCDLLVIGAGPAGLAAALTAGRAGARVILADEGFEPGGSLLSETAQIGRTTRRNCLPGTIAELESLPNVRVMTRTTMFGWYDGNVFGARRACAEACRRSPIPTARSNGFGGSRPSRRSSPPARKSGRWCLAATTFPA